MWNSLRGRLLLAASLILITFVVLTGLALQRAFLERALQVEQDKLQGLIYALLGASDLDAGGDLEVDEAELPDKRLSRPDSGLYLAVLDEMALPIWKSPSFLWDLPDSSTPSVGEWRFQSFNHNQVGKIFLLSFGVRWASEGSTIERYTFLAIEDSKSFHRQLLVFQRTLFIWLAMAAILLLGILMLVLHWGLNPVKRIASDLKAIEGGDKEQMEGSYPDELLPLTTSLNALLRHERNRQQRYRDALDDLAHSLKTPLAVLRGLAGSHGAQQEYSSRVAEQVSRMDQIVSYQLQKAATTGTRLLAKAIAVRPIVDKVVGALTKVHHEKAIEYRIEVSPSLTQRVDSGDLIELLGNLVDNASKWCKSWVYIKGERAGGFIKIEVIDDGPGYPPDSFDALLKRGVRADSQIDGQGIGLSVVAEIVHAYEGQIYLDNSPGAGARVELRFPVT